MATKLACDVEAPPQDPARLVPDPKQSAPCSQVLQKKTTKISVTVRDFSMT